MPSIYFVTIAGSLLLALHIALKWGGEKIGEGLDLVALGLAIVALSPWIARLIESAKIGSMEFKFVAQKIEKQQERIDIFTFLISHFLSQAQIHILQRLSSGEYYEIDVNVFPDEFKADLRHLRGLGFIVNHDGKGIRSMYETRSTPKRNVHDFFKVTESGRTFLQLRSEATSRNA